NWEGGRDVLSRQAVEGMQGFELLLSLPACDSRDLVTPARGFRAFQFGLGDQPGPVETEVELPYLLEPVAPVSNATESLEHLRLVFRRVCLEPLRTAGHRLLGRPTPQVREQVDLQAGLIERYANLAVTPGVLLPPA